jgi:hypothetical protein
MRRKNLHIFHMQSKIFHLNELSYHKYIENQVRLACCVYVILKLLSKYINFLEKNNVCTV